MLGISLAACCGFRIFLPFLAVSIAAYFKVIPLSDSLEWLGSWQALVCFSVAAVAEVVAYYVPFLDNLLDTITTPLSVVAGGIMASSVIPVGQDQMLTQWILTAIGGGILAGSIQGGTGFLRLFSSKATIGAGNVLIASGENAAALTGIFLSFAVPVIACLLLASVSAWFLFKTVSRLTNRHENMF